MKFCMRSIIVVAGLFLGLPLPGAGMSMEELQSFLAWYRTNPCPAKVSAILRDVADQCDGKPTSVAPMAGFFGRVFKDNAAHAPEWRSAVSGLAKGTFRTALEQELDGKLKLPASGTDFPPELLDYCWGAYMASGDLALVDRVVDCALAPRPENGLSLSAMTASWSVRSFAATDANVRRRLNERLKKADDASVLAFFESPANPETLKTVCDPDLAERVDRLVEQKPKSPLEEAEWRVGRGDLTGALAALERAPTNDWRMCYAIGDFYGTHAALPTNRAERLHCWMDRAYQMADGDWKRKVAGRCASGLCIRRYGYPEDWHSARLWLHRAADSGSAYWQCMLADAYVYSYYGIPVDGKKALYYLEKAEKQNHVKTHHVRASMYEKGIGLPKDYKKALECLESGMRRGSDVCPRNYAIMLIHGRGGDSRRAEGFSMLQKLVAKGVEGPGYCLSILGTACERGEGVMKDMSRAIEFYKQAATLKNAYSIKRLKALKVKWPEE